jgi:Tfp pilus assembly protein PilX
MAPPRRQRGNGLWIMLIIVLLVALAAVGWLALRFNGIL